MKSNIKLQGKNVEVIAVDDAKEMALYAIDTFINEHKEVGVLASTDNAKIIIEEAVRAGLDLGGTITYSDEEDTIYSVGFLNEDNTNTVWCEDMLSRMRILHHDEPTMELSEVIFIDNELLNSPFLKEYVEPILRGVDIGNDTEVIVLSTENPCECDNCDCGCLSDDDIAVEKNGVALTVGELNDLIDNALAEKSSIKEKGTYLVNGKEVSKKEYEEAEKYFSDKFDAMFNDFFKKF